MAGLVYIGKVTEVIPIEGADRIESLKVICGSGGVWRGSAQKLQFPVGSQVQVYLQDSLLPHTDELSFMEKNHWRVRMLRLKGTPSEVLITAQTIAGDVGTDITELAGVTKYEKPMPANMSGETLGWFPVNLIPKTDEPNFQTVPEMVSFMRGKLFYSTSKADGSSATVFKYQGHFGCCSRNLELRESPKNAVWQIARQYKLEEFVNEGTSLQFECVGAGIQGNPMGLKGVEPRLFNIYDISGHQYLDGDSVRAFAELTKVPMVEIVDWNKPFEFQSDEELRKYAEGLYPNGHQREGVVIRPMVESRMDTGERVSMKIINLLYKEG